MDGWMATSELSWCSATALRAASSALALIVVVRFGTLVGATITARLFGTSLSLAVWIST